jgi:hypothetical protein
MLAHEPMIEGTEVASGEADRALARGAAGSLAGYAPM